MIFISPLSIAANALVSKTGEVRAALTGVAIWVDAHNQNFSQIGVR